MKVNVTEKFKEKIFLISLSSLITMYMFKLTTGFQIPLFNYFLLLLRAFAYILIVLKIILDFIQKKFSCKEIIIYLIVGMLLSVVAYQSKLPGYFVFYIYIIGAKNVEYKKIILWTMITYIICGFIIILSSKVGILEDVIFSKGDRNRHGLGFDWATNASNHYMYIVLSYIYIRQNKMKWFEYIVLLLFNIVLYILTDTKSAFCMVIIALFSAFLISYFKAFQKYYKFYNYISVFLVFFLPLIILTLTYFYNPNIIFFEKLNRILSGRLQLGKNAFNEYGITLFAKYIRFVGGEIHNAEKYNYVDSSFVKYFINFGVIFFILLMSYLVYVVNIINKRKDLFLLLCIMIILLHTTFDPQLLLIEYNDFLFLGGMITNNAFNSSK